jgi:2,3-bisphosphoglycerate-dependent phosphoglycerate mutase
LIHDNVEFDFYFIRHGESESNVNPHMSVSLGANAPMTERGHKQAEAAGERLGREGVKFDKIYSSSLVRAVQTTENILRLMGIPDAEFAQVDDIIEQRVSDGRENVARHVMSADDQMVKAEKGQFFKDPDHETFRSVERRASNWLEDEIIYNPEWYEMPGTHTIAIVSHGGTLRSLLHYIAGIDNRLAMRSDIFNCSISRFRFGKLGWSIGSINDSSHTLALGDIARRDGNV